MTCPTCGRYAPPDRETGYDGDEYCSVLCAKVAEQREQLEIWEREEHMANVHELRSRDRMQKALAIYFLLYYGNPLQTAENSDNGVTTPNRREVPPRL